MRRLSLTFCFAATFLFAGLSLACAAPPTKVGSGGGCNPAENLSAPPCLSQPCDSHGTTMVDRDKKNIIACLTNESGGGTIWKAMTSITASAACPTGEIMVGISGGTPLCRSLSCPSGTAFTGISTAGPVCGRLVQKNCIWKQVTPSDNHFHCWNDGYVAGFMFEDKAGADEPDDLALPEVKALYCCRVGAVADSSPLGENTVPSQPGGIVP